KYDGIVAVFKKDEISNAPTKLKNNWLFKPFEMLVKMYGTPAYNELDPTPFLSLSYMFLFGMMFGDLGQGFVILLAGLLVGRKSKTFGGLLTRLGASSMVFGTLYGAVFGFETIIPALLIRPFENINTMLIIAIGVGVTLLIIAYIHGIINAFKRKDIEEAVFGNKGI
ncbi:V-type ATPase 116kDa subunit family protein, partial [Vibrio parahaemolyticus]|nr:V-type ATPase 116kDa subunit family protein [Vibrio parahaemolyticus]